jgi:PAS domain S-box-containing protein
MTEQPSRPKGVIKAVEEPGVVTQADLRSFESVGALVVVLDVDDRIVYWNQPCSEGTGYSLEEVRGRRFWEFLLAPDEVESSRSVLATLRAEQRPSRSASYWITKTGERRWIAWSNTVTMGPDGGPRYAIQTGIDRSESKRAEDKLSGIISIASDAIISIDDEQRIVMYNQGAETIFGWSAAEVMGKPFDILLPERFRDVHRLHLRGFASGDVTARQMGQRIPAIFGLRNNGEEFAAQAAISKLDIGGSRLFTVVLRDVSEQKRRERERDLLAELGATLADTVDYGDTLTRIASLVVRDLADFCIVDLVESDGKMRRVKVLHRDPAMAGLCETFQRLPVEGAYAPIVSSVIESKQPRLMAEVSSQYLESAAQDDEHLRALRKLAPRSLIVVPLWARGRLLGTLVLVSSHPSRRYTGDDLHLAGEVANRAALAIETARLFQRAWNATHDLREANQQMVSATIRAQELTEEAEAATARATESERELREIGEFRDMFIGILGHDLRGPVAAINMTAANLLRRPHLDEQAKNHLARIITGSQRMIRMISQLLDLTRARLGGGFPLEPKPVDLREVCRNVVEEFEAPIHLEVEGDVTGNWDPDRLTEALSNIAGNAVEHAAPGTVVVVKAHAEGPEVVVEIINQGDPIPGDLLPFIFEPFRRASSGRSRQPGISASASTSQSRSCARGVARSRPIPTEARRLS